MRHKFYGFRWSKATEKEIRQYMQDFIHSKTKINNNGCWKWQGSLSKWGYGDVRIGPVSNKRHVNAHRAAWLYFNESIPSGLFVCHKCDVRSCCNPDHLFLGTAKQNQQDMIKKNRKNVLKGDACPYSKRNEKTVIEIIQMLASGANCAEVGRRFNIDRRQISDIKRGRRWGHIGDRTGIKIIRANSVHLDEKTAKEIKLKFKDGARIVDISKEYAISRSTIDDIKKNKTWKHVSCD